MIWRHVRCSRSSTAAASSSVPLPLTTYSAVAKYLSSMITPGSHDTMKLRDDQGGDPFTEPQPRGARVIDPGRPNTRRVGPGHWAPKCHSFMIPLGAPWNYDTSRDRAAPDAARAFLMPPANRTAHRRRCRPPGAGRHLPGPGCPAAVGLGETRRVRWPPGVAGAPASIAAALCILRALAPLRGALL
jgi:hypothetical protein